MALLYRNLSTDTDEIRLIEIQPQETVENAIDIGTAPNDAQDDVPIVCTLFEAPLQQAPSYTALSYTWGEPSPRHPLTVDGVTVYVTRNLESALRQLRKTYGRFVLWVDYLCINQKDEEEKNHQVGKMQDIYQRASSVIVWLGPSHADSDLAMDWAAAFGGRSCGLDLGERPETQLVRVLEHLDAGRDDQVAQALQRFARDLHEQFRDGSATQAALTALFARPYWSRVWVVQEIAVATQVSFLCGPRMLGEEELHHTTRLLRNYAFYSHLSRSSESTRFEASPIATRRTPAIADPKSAINMLKIRRASCALPFIYLVRMLRQLRSTDPRDKIFAMLGIAADAADLGLVPDYRLDAATVYTHVATALLRTGYVEILALCGRGPEARLEGLSSWVPDWSHLPVVGPLQIRALDRTADPPRTVLMPEYGASGGVGADDSLTFRQDDDGSNIARIPVLFLGTVVAVSAPAKPPNTVGTWVYELACLASAPPPSYKPILSSSPASSHLLSSASKPSNPLPHLRLPTRHAVYRTATADQGVQRAASKPRMPSTLVDQVDAALVSVADLRAVAGPALGERGEGLSGFVSQAAAVARARWGIRVAVEGARTAGENESVAVPAGEAVARDARMALGVAPADVVVGDEVGIVTGGRTAVVVRRVETSEILADAHGHDGCGHGGGQYRLIGEAYVHGFMDGEAFGRKRSFQMVDLT